MDQMVGEASDGAAVRVPGIGETCRFRVREWKSGRLIFPAIVLNGHENGCLTVLVVFGVDDMIEQRNVPMYSETIGQGWLPLEDAAPASVGAADGAEPVVADLEQFKDEMADVIFGDNERHEKSLYDVIGSLSAELERALDRITVLENMVAPVTRVSDKPASGRQRRAARRGG